ncbi:hypothetical protein CSA17_01350 [bacterium DOLJORAL78_65_58]|nr:MAG: hypothetical protein CSB20_06205 [bacterium DOLZORAL124_64_63]PIE76604.1 MAG: hypothetical protein CSA17_01350 [bacterium DOLJORAL78_65_58]
MSIRLNPANSNTMASLRRQSPRDRKDLQKSAAKGQGGECARRAADDAACHQISSAAADTPTEAPVRFEDADAALEVANTTGRQILDQGATSAQAQGQGLTDTALGLLQ